MNCTSCGAPLSADSIVCPFCKTANDLDLRSARRKPRADRQSDRPCPRCKENMPTIDIGREESLLIERCEECLGLFFDPGELEHIAEKDVRAGTVADRDRLQQIVEEETPTDDIKGIRYVPCPDCRKLMNRTCYGARSGVIVDTCKEHGVWLDGGELRRILHWLHAGGRVHHAKLDAEDKRLKERRENLKQHLDKIDARRLEPNRQYSHGDSGMVDIVDVLIGLFD